MTGDPLDNFEKQMQTCVEYMAKSDAEDPLRPLLVRLLLVSAYGAYEKAIRDAVCRRARESSDGKFVWAWQLERKLMTRTRGCPTPDTLSPTAGTWI